MRKFLLLLFLLIQCSLFVIHSVSAQSGQWVWIHGSSTVNSSGSLGTQGVPSPTNDPPGLYEPCEWTDNSGNFWLYGGSGLGGSSHNDLWRYEPATNEWTWMTGTNNPGDAGNYGVQGVAAASNRPPGLALGVVTWVDPDGNLWMFGGNNSGGYSDMWKYDPQTNLWTWMKGPGVTGQGGVYGTLKVPDSANNPGNRWEVATGWTSTDTSGNGTLWLFGGSGNFNDMWRYDLATNVWTWMKGSSSSGQSGVYGTKGVEDSTNTPGCRSAYCRWKDKFGNLWLYGGFDYSNRTFSDLWRFNPASNNWTWMNGSNLANVNPLYGTRCVYSSSNTPGARMENRAAWTDVNGGFWMFGGTASPRTYNDLWLYCIVTNQWTWVSGDTVANSSGSWGTKGVFSATNKPDSRYGSVTWRDNNNNLYLFGGHGGYNDLWKYVIDTTCSFCAGRPPLPAFQSDTDICEGGCVNMVDQSTYMPTSYHWIFQGGAPASSNYQNPTVCYSSAGIYDITLIETNIYGSDTLVRSQYINVNSPGAPPAVTRSGDTLFVPQGYVAYQWYYQGALINGATNYSYLATQSGTYAIDITDIHGCHIYVDFIDVILAASSRTLLEGNEELKIYPNPTKDNFQAVFFSQKPSPAKIVLVNVLGEVVYSEVKTVVAGNNIFFVNTTDIPSGIYTVQVNIDGELMKTNVIVEK